MPTTISLRHISKTFSPYEQREAHSLNSERARRHMGVRQEHLPEEVDRLQALKDITLTARGGDTLAVLGPSGCGKTTLLRIVAGLLAPTAGQVLYDGEDVTDIPPAERGVGMVFQSYALYPHMPSVDNIGMFLRLHKREQEIPPRVREISELMHIDLGPLLSRKPPTLSGGERQRVAIARCLARDPRVFLFDEPFSNLDAKMRTEARVELKRLLHRYEVTSIYVTHDQVEAIALAHRIAVLREGQLIQIGTYQQLYETPVNTFVAGFFGRPTMNLFTGYVHDGKWQGDAFSWRPIRTDLNEGDRVILGVRPEHFRLDENGDITTKVEMIEPLFAERAQIVYTVAGVQRITVWLPLDISIQRGDLLRLSIVADQVHLFDYKTQARLG